MKKSWKTLLIITLIVLIVIIFFHNTLTPIFFSLAEVEAVKIANKAINEAIDQEAATIKYDDMIRYVENKDGEIMLMQPNVQYINSFTSKISLKIQNKLDIITRQSVAIPLASIFGIDLISGLGPDINVRVIPIGFTKPPLVRDSFTTAGINQTRHKIYLEVTVQLKLIVPFSSKLLNVTADVPVTEVTILGRVPQVYIGLNEDTLKGILK